MRTRDECLADKQLMLNTTLAFGKTYQWLKLIIFTIIKYTNKELTSGVSWLNGMKHEKAVFSLYLCYIWESSLDTGCIEIINWLCNRNSLRLFWQISRGVTTLTNAVWAILGVNLSRPGNLDHPPEFLGYISLDVPIFFCNVPEL